MTVVPQRRMLILHAPHGAISNAVISRLGGTGPDGRKIEGSWCVFPKGYVTSLSDGVRRAWWNWDTGNWTAEDWAWAAKVVTALCEAGAKVVVK